MIHTHTHTYREREGNVGRNLIQALGHMIVRAGKSEICKVGWQSGN